MVPRRGPPSVSKRLILPRRRGSQRVHRHVQQEDRVAAGLGEKVIEQRLGERRVP
jgi:hypothetical protein